MATGSKKGKTIEMSVKDEVTLPESIKKMVSGVKFGWLVQDMIDRYVQEITEDQNVVCQEFSYLVKKSYTSYLVDKEFNMTRIEHQKGFPVILKNKNTGDVVGFLFIDKSEIEDMCFFDEEERSSILHMYKTLVETKEEDIKFNLMVNLI